MNSVSNECSAVASAAETSFPIPVSGPYPPLAATRSNVNTEAIQLLPPLPRPTNFLSITTGGMSGDFIINPNIQIPNAPVEHPQDKFGANRKNLSLTATHGNINAVIWLVGNAGVGLSGGAVELQNRASLAVNSEQGFVTLKVCRLVPIPITLDITSVQSCSIYLPRSFHGSLTLAGYKSISISEGLKADLTTISETNYSLQAFVGDLNGREKILAKGTDQCSVNVTQDQYPMKVVDVRYEDELDAAKGHSIVLP